LFIQQGGAMKRISNSRSSGFLWLASHTSLGHRVALAGQIIKAMAIG
jgi:hypothetical protein